MGLIWHKSKWGSGANIKGGQRFPRKWRLLIGRERSRAQRMTSYHFRWRKPLTSWKKRIVGSYNRKSRGLRWETAGECEKRIVGSRWVKTAEKTRAQSPAAGVTHIWSIYGFDMAQVQVGQRGKYKRESAVSQKMEASDWSRAITCPEDDVISFPVEETADQLEKRIVGSYNRKSRGLRWETAGECEKRIVGSRWVKTAEKTRAQSPAAGVTHIWSIYGFDMAQVQVGQRGKYKRGSAVSQKMEASDWSRAIT